MCNFFLKRINSTILAIGILFLFIFLVFPFLWLLISSFKHPVELYTIPVIWIPKHITIQGYLSLLKSADFLSSLFVSALVATATTLISLAVGSLGAYALARLRFPARRALFFSILTTQVLPAIVLLIPLYMVFRVLNLVGKYTGLIISHVSFTLPYVIWLLYSYIINIPKELEEAAWVDGCSRLKALIHVVLPVTLPGLISTSIFAFVGSWNDLMYSLIISGARIKTITVKLAEFIAQERIVYELMFPGAIIATVPVIIIAFLCQRYIIQGITEGALKM